jgi:nucleoside-diphosphate-sugar epimerase
LTARPTTAPLTEADLEACLSRPGPEVGDALARLGGDILVLGAGGKMGPTLCVMARRALDERGSRARVIAVARFSEPGLEARLAAAGVETRRADLAERAQVARLPEAPNVLFLAGRKFGAATSPSLTWAANVLVPVHVIERWPDARLVAFSTGNVYPLVPVSSGGARETDPVGPVGEYAMSCLGRERLFQHAAETRGTRILILRLNYAVELRYGVLVDIGRRILAGEPVDLRMGYVNVIWQGDANARALQGLALAASPAAVLNVTGPEVVSVRWLAEELGRRLGRPPIFTGTEAPDALLSNAARSIALFGPPTISLETMLDWTAEWLRRGGRLLDKPTRFEEREGRF